MSSLNTLEAGFFGLLGLLIGSFLNVVIYRLPKMMERQWTADCAGVEGAGPRPALEPFNLLTPRSACPHCGHQILWYENIPVLSFLALRGKCSRCGSSIGWRYPAVELVTAAFFTSAYCHHGATLAGAVWSVFACLLIVQFMIDFDTQLLPDDVNYVLLWGGLVAAALGVSAVPLYSAVWGAVWGYLSLWMVFHVYRLLTGKEGFGYGDFKLLAGLGAWFGGEYLIALILLSSIVGSLIGGVMLMVGKLANKDIPIPFGPYLAGAGLVAMIVGPAKLTLWVPFAFPFSSLAR
jgi:leader peptidase (prepilin peptidase) / N-methyltransferase